MPKFYNVMRASGEYVNKDGDTKTSWNPVGKLMRKDDGKLSLLFYLTGEWYPCFPDEREEKKEDPDW